LPLPFPPQTPQAYTLGNLARAGYGATEEGVFPYSYNSCDVGTFPNQTNLDGTPTAATTNGDPQAGGVISTLLGQKLSACTCPDGDHPNPSTSLRGRGAPQIDILNAQTTAAVGDQVSQTFRFAPMNAAYAYPAAAVEIKDATVAKVNGYKGRATCVTFPLLSLAPLCCETKLM
jgi:beta-glucanase (GH16 family)